MVGVTGFDHEPDGTKAVPTPAIAVERLDLHIPNDRGRREISFATVRSWFSRLGQHISSNDCNAVPSPEMEMRTSLLHSPWHLPGSDSSNGP